MHKLYLIKSCEDNLSNKSTENYKVKKSTKDASPYKKKKTIQKYTPAVFCSTKKK